MKHLRTNPIVKAVAFLLCLILSVGAFWGTLLTIARWDELWSGGDFYASSLVGDRLDLDAEQVVELGALCQLKQWDGSLNYRDQQRVATLTELFSAAESNFRFQIHNQAGDLLCGNVPEGGLKEQAQRVFMFETNIYQAGRGAIHFPRNYVYYTESPQSFGDSQIWDSTRGSNILKVFVNNTAIFLSPEQSEEASNYGWSYDNGEWEYDLSQDSRIKSAILVVEYGLANDLTARDNYQMLQSDFINFQDSLPIIAIIALCLDVLTLALLGFLCSAAGRREGTSAIRLNWQDRIPYDLYLALGFGAVMVLIEAGDAITFAMNSDGLLPETLIGLCCISLGVAGCILAALFTTAVRLKTHTLLRNTLIWRFFKTLGRGFRSVGRWFGRLVRNWPLVWRVGLGFFGYLFISIVTAPTVILFILWQFFILWSILLWIKQWRSIRLGAAHIVGGDPDYAIDTKKMFPDLREHAAQLNDLGSAISSAVDERLRSERFKAELITNVSHDLKTPLTSIINYVDLLKKEEIPSPKAQEYLEVLERKSQRLKKLTEDLVEASKASTGNLTVVKTRLGMCQLVEQAAAEYEEKFHQKELLLIPALPDSECYVEADGRHIWRVLDNLLGNCCKYAMEGTRVYLNVTCLDGTVTLAVKNVSRQQLNVSPEQLMERFVRGEESRTTEGSGLGLSIARSLTELQGGTFRLEIDGDLFKAIVTFPEGGETPPALPELELAADKSSPL